MKIYIHENTFDDGRYVTPTQVFFYEDPVYNAAVFTDGIRWICFCNEVCGIDLYSETAVSDLTKLVERANEGDWGGFDNLYKLYRRKGSGVTTGDNFGIVFFDDRGLTLCGTIDG